MDEDDYLQCVKCGYCCTQSVCPFGQWDSIKHQCVFLTKNNLCSEYEEIRRVHGPEFSPAFGGGCSSPMFNERRDAKIVQDSVGDE